MASRNPSPRSSHLLPQDADADPPPPPLPGPGCHPLPPPAATTRLGDLPEEILVLIFRHLLELDLCHVAQVCKRFRDIASSSELWKRLYRELYEYDLPLVQREPRAYAFSDPEKSKDDNPWRTSFIQFYHGLHVRAGYRRIVRRGRTIKYFDTISNALDFVKANDGECSELIFVHAGTYGGFVLRNKVTLIGAAPGEIKKYVILRSDFINSVYIVQGAKDAYIGYLTIQFSPSRSPSSESRLDGCSLAVSGHCEPTVEHCILQCSSNARSVVCISGVRSNPVVKNCSISECKSGTESEPINGRGCSESDDSNDTCRDRLYGIWVENGANPTVQGNFIRSEVGIAVCERETTGIYINNDISDDTEEGVEAPEEESGVKKCNLKPEEIGCVYVHNEGGGVFEDNKLHSRKIPGVCISTKGAPTIKNNKISKCPIGVLISTGSGGLIEENNIVGCDVSGILISNSNPAINRNKIHRGNLGIDISLKSQATLIENEIYSNTGAGVRIESGSDPKLRLNRIYSSGIGVYIHERSLGDLEENVIYNNEHSNINIETKSNPSIRRNKIRGGKNGGVVISNGGLGKLEENDIFDNNVAGVLIKEVSDPTLIRNKIFDGKEYGVLITDCSRGYLEGNDIFRNAYTGLMIADHSDPVVRANRIFSGEESGVEITENATATLEYNHIFNNAFGGLSKTTYVVVIQRGNKIYKNKDAVSVAAKGGHCLYRVCRREVLHELHACPPCGAMPVAVPVGPSLGPSVGQSLAVCVSCAKNCHVGLGHNAEFVRRGRFACACGSGVLGVPCRLQGGVAPETVSPRVFPALMSPRPGPSNEFLASPPQCRQPPPRYHHVPLQFHQLPSPVQQVPVPIPFQQVPVPIPIPIPVQQVPIPVQQVPIQYQPAPIQYQPAPALDPHAPALDPHAPALDPHAPALDQQPQLGVPPHHFQGPPL